MRVLHTSDWHLGRKLGGHPLLREQEKFCDWLVDFVTDEQIRVVAISGDLFDRSIPPIEAIGLLSDTFRRLRDAGSIVVAIAGNHDSATRLAMADGFTEAGGLYLRGGYSNADAVTPVEVDGELLQLVTVPFLDPHMAPASVADSLREGGRSVTHESTLARVLDSARAALDPSLPSLVLSHAFVTNARPSPSERELSVGDAAMVSAQIFEGFDYVALGHLHRPQVVGGRDYMRYSGSPLPYSFSETGPKSVVLADLTEPSDISVEVVEIPVGRRVSTVRGHLSDLVSGEGNTRDWVRAELTDSLRPVDAARELRRNHPHLAQVDWVGGTSTSPGLPELSTLRVRTPHDLMCDFWQAVRGEAPSAAVSSVLESLLEESDAVNTSSEHAA